VAAVFDTPVATVGGKHALRVGLLRSSAGDAMGDVTRVFAAFFICGLPLDDKRLSDVREVEIAVEFGCDPNFPDFNPAVIRRVAMDKIGVLPVLIWMVRLPSWSDTGRVPTFFGCSRFCSDDRLRS